MQGEKQTGARTMTGTTQSKTEERGRMLLGMAGAHHIIS
jgi:hypothetical protein